MLCLRDKTKLLITSWPLLVKYEHIGISKMPIFIDNIAIIFRSLSPYFTLSCLVHKSRTFKEILKSDVLESLADLESGKYEAYLPEIAVHKTI